MLVLLSLPAYHADKESSEARFHRLETIARAIDSASLEATCTGPFADADEWCRPVWGGSRAELAALLVAVAWHETRLARHIHEGRCAEYECDAVRLPDGRLFHRARSVWQLHASGLVPPPVWREIVGTAYYPTTRAAYAAASVLGAGVRRCGSVNGAVAFYAKGTGCRWSGAAPRVVLYRRIISRLTTDGA